MYKENHILFYIEQVKNKIGLKGYFYRFTEGFSRNLRELTNEEQNEAENIIRDCATELNIESQLIDVITERLLKCIKLPHINERN